MGYTLAMLFLLLACYLPIVCAVALRWAFGDETWQYWTPWRLLKRGLIAYGVVIAMSQALTVIFGLAGWPLAVWFVAVWQLAAMFSIPLSLVMVIVAGLLARSRSRRSRRPDYRPRWRAATVLRLRVAASGCIAAGGASFILSPGLDKVAGKLPWLSTLTSSELTVLTNVLGGAGLLALVLGLWLFHIASGRDPRAWRSECPQCSHVVGAQGVPFCPECGEDLRSSNA